jgi:superkiller protein 3
MADFFLTLSRMRSPRPGALRFSACVLIVLLVASCGGSANRKSQARVDTINDAKAQAKALMDAGDNEGALAILEPLAVEDLGHAPVHAMIGEARWALGDRAGAIEAYEDALRINQMNGEYHLDLATLLMETGRTGRALTEFALAEQYSAQDPLVSYNYGLALYDLGRREEAIERLELALELDAQNARFASALGIAYAGVDDARSVELLSRAAKLGADTPQFHNNYGLALRRAGSVERARAEFRTALAEEPDNPVYQTNLAVAHMQVGEFAKAVPIWQDLLAQVPDGRTPRTYLGRSYLELENYQAVVDVLEDWLLAQNPREETASSWNKFAPPAATVPEPGPDEAFDVLGMAWRGLGAGEKAADYLERAVALAPENTVHLNNYGVVLAESGNIAAARSQWEKVLQIDPKNSLARRNLASVGPD